MGYEDRLVPCFKGLATGDAVGKQTEKLSRADVQKWYPGGVTGFHGPRDTFNPTPDSQTEFESSCTALRGWMCFEESGPVL